MRSGFSAFVLVASLLVPTAVFAQSDGGAPPEAATADAGAAPSNPHGTEDRGGFRALSMPESFAEESNDVPPGAIFVRVVDSFGNAISEAPVRLGGMREGERVQPLERRTGPDGVARFERLAMGGNIAYRASVEHEGAKFSAMPFQLPTNTGYRVQLVRHAVEREPRAILFSDVQCDISFQDDRLVVLHRFNVVNFSAISLDGSVPRPYAWVPGEAFRFRLPPGYSVFRSEERSMGDQRLEEENGYAVFRGSIPPSSNGTPVQLTFQYRIKLEGRSELPIEMEFPSLPVLRAAVASQAPAGIRLEVQGFPDPQERTHEGQRVFVTGLTRQSREDPELRGLRIRLSGIPAAAGPERNAAALLAVAILLGSVFFALLRRGDSKAPAMDKAQLRAEKTRILEELAALNKAHKEGELGPETYARMRRELIYLLASVLQTLETAK